MTTINLKRYYPYMTENVMLEVSDEIAAALSMGGRLCDSYKRQKRRNGECSLDTDPGFEADVLRQPMTPDELAERSTQPLTRCWQTGREDSAEDNETCSRPPTDLRGSSCGMRQPSTGSGAVGLCSRSHRRSGILPVPGMRGKYGTQQSYSEPSNRVFLSYDSPNHSGAAAPSFVD